MSEIPATIRRITVVVVVLTVAACGSAWNPMPADTPAMAPRANPTAGGPTLSTRSAGATVAVHGTETCQIVEADYTVDPLRERFHCQEFASDSRVSGEWDTWILTHGTGGGVGTWTAEFVMTNSGGTWRGTGTGTVTGMPSNPTNLGLVEWVGEGGYLGLAYHEFLYGSNARLVTAGWVEPARAS